MLYLVHARWKLNVLSWISTKPCKPFICHVFHFHGALCRLINVRMLEKHLKDHQGIINYWPCTPDAAYQMRVGWSQPWQARHISRHPYGAADCSSDSAEKETPGEAANAIPEAAIRNWVLAPRWEIGGSFSAPIMLAFFCLSTRCQVMRQLVLAWID